MIASHKRLREGWQRLYDELDQAEGEAKRTGLAELDRALEEDRRLAKRLHQTMPTTPAGAAALIQYILDDDGVAPEEEYWHMAALRSTVAALNKMNGAVQS